MRISNIFCCCCEEKNWEEKTPLFKDRNYTNPPPLVHFEYRETHDENDRLSYCIEFEDPINKEKIKLFSDKELDLHEKLAPYMEKYDFLCTNGRF